MEATLYIISSGFYNVPNKIFVGRGMHFSDVPYTRRVIELPDGIGLAFIKNEFHVGGGEILVLDGEIEGIEETSGVIEIFDSATGNIIKILK